MRSLTLIIDISSYWHAGSGHSGSGDVDSAIVRDAVGLPLIPGRTLKGLFRDAADLWVTWNPGTLDVGSLFGREGGTPDRPSGQLHFSDACLPSDFTSWAASLEKDKKKINVLQGLVETISSTAIDSQGIALDRSLRKFEAAIPMALESTVRWESGPGDEAIRRSLADLAPLVRRLGSHRHRGYGRCTITVK